MGTTDYSYSDRVKRAKASGYYSKSADQIFTQSIVRKAHPSMLSQGALMRESRDSEAHPNSVPIIIVLDVTGSMRKIPHYLVKDGLPKIMDGIIQAGVNAPQILFLAIGDCVYDSYPLQVGQFESGDKELDMWLTRTYLEGGGGSNKEESYLEAYYYAAFHTVTDAWEKRKQKGYLFTIGDEPSMNKLEGRAIKEIMGVDQAVTYSLTDLLAKAQEKYNVYHLHIMEGNAGPRSLGFWKDLLDQNCIQIDNHENVSDVIKDIVTSDVISISTTTDTNPSNPVSPSTIIL